MSLENLTWTLDRLEENTMIKPFESEDDELNDFLFWIRAPPGEYPGGVLNLCNLLDAKPHEIGHPVHTGAAEKLLFADIA